MDDFYSYWERVTVREIQNELWLIDPCVSYGNINDRIVKITSIESDKHPDKNYIKQFLHKYALQEILNEYRKTKLPYNKEIKSDYHAAFREAYPWKVGIELTSVCNFNCHHCYANSLTKESPTKKEVFSLMDDLEKCGVVWLWFTGGECTSRRDFVDIYAYAKNKGFIVHFLTNGSRINDDLVETLKKYPPTLVKISLYGATSKSYEEVTGVKNSFSTVIAGIKKLLDNNIRIMIQCVVTKNNESEIDAMGGICKDFNVEYNFSSQMIPRLNSDITPIDYESAREESKNIHIEKLVQYYKNNLQISKDVRRQFTDKGEFFCGAGYNSCFISSDMRCYPCLMGRAYGINLRSNSISFEEAFSKLVESRPNYLKIPLHCQHCQATQICGICDLRRVLFNKKLSRLHTECNDIKEIYKNVQQQKEEKRP